MAKPDWAHYAKAISPFAIAAAALGGATWVHSASGIPASLKELLPEGATGLLVNGLSALCKFGRFRAGREYQETLTNHDILRLIRSAWGEASVAALKLYLAHANLDPLRESSIIDPVTVGFRDTVGKLKPEDFGGDDISIHTVRAAIKASRQALLGEKDPEAALPDHVVQLQAALIDSVTKTLSDKLVSTDRIPAELRRFLGQEGGIVDQLVIHTAFHLKTDHRAQIAILHSTLQEISDCQNRIEAFFTTVYEAQSESGRAVIDALKQQTESQHTKICADIDQKLNDEHRPVLDPPFDSIFDPPELTYRSRATAFVGRESSLDALIEFLGDPRPGLWTVVSGPAGSGKNRLAAELIAMAGGPHAPVGRWRAGFLRSSEAWLRTDAVKWRRDTDTLLVIDYAGELRREALSDFLAHMHTSEAIFSTSRMRVILLDRLPPDSELGVATRLMSGSDQRGAIKANRWRQEDADLLSLGPVAEESALQIARGWAGQAWIPEAVTRVERALQEDSELARPLFALLIGDEIRFGSHPKGVLNPVTVSAAALDRLFARSDPDLLEQAKMLWVAATACQGIAEDDLLEEEPLRLLTGEDWPDTRLKRLQNRMRSMSGFGGNVVTPLQPDFLGGLFVLKLLLSLPAKRYLGRATSFMTFAWKHGLAPDAFVTRLAADFTGREGQVADATQSTGDRVKTLLIQLVLSGLIPEARERGGPDSVGFCVYLASKAGQSATAFKFLEALEGEPQELTDELAAALAKAWFGFALSADLPPSARDFAPRAMRRIEELLQRHNTAAIALINAEALYNATVAEPESAKRGELAKRIGEIRREHNTVEIASAQARALFNATAVDLDPARCEELAERIGEIRREHNTADIALEQARALYNAVESEPDAGRCEQLAERIGEIRTEHNTSDIAEAQARALSATSVVEPDQVRCEQLAERIGEIRREHNTAEIAEAQARALGATAVVEPEPAKREQLADRIGEIRREHNTADLAFLQAEALGVAVEAESELPRRKRLAECIREIRREHNTADIALVQATALAKAALIEPDVAQRERLAISIGEIRREHNTAGIALLQANVLSRAAVGESDLAKRESLADCIGEIRREHGTPGIALMQVGALIGATAVEPDPVKREKLLDRIGEIRREDNTADIALAEARVLLYTTVGELDPTTCEKHAERIAEIGRDHNTGEIALCEAKALLNAISVEPEPAKREELAERIGELLDSHGLGPDDVFGDK